jgi:hypothetical protein
MSFTYDANLGEFLPLGQGDGCAQLDRMDLGKHKLVHMLLAPWKKEKCVKNDLMWPSNFEGDGGFHLNLLKNPFFFWSSSFFIHITYNGKVDNFLKFVL